MSFRYLVGGLMRVGISSCPPLWPLLALYIIWIYLDKSPEYGGRLSPSVRSWRFWKYFSEYYPSS